MYPSFPKTSLTIAFPQKMVSYVLACHTLCLPRAVPAKNSGEKKERRDTSHCKGLQWQSHCDVAYPLFVGRSVTYS